MIDIAGPRWSLKELPGRTLVLVKDCAHRHEVRPPFLSATVVVAIKANGIAIYARPTNEQWPPCKSDLMLVIPAAAITMDNLEDFFPDQTAAEIFHCFRLNRRHLLQLAVDNTRTNDISGEPGKPKRKEV